VAQTKFVIYERSLKVWEERPKLAGYIATISQLWSAIEYELAVIFVTLSGSNLSLGRVFHDIVGIHTKLGMLETLVATLIPDDVERYEKLKERVRDKAQLRNKIVHGTWSLRKDKPDQAFLHLLFPITLAEAEAVAYTRKKFVDTANNFLGLYKEVAEFREHVGTLSQKQPFPRPFLLRKKPPKPAR
jgi:hypothetical protein